MKNIIKSLAIVFVFIGIFNYGAKVSLAAPTPTIVSATTANITTNSADLNGIINPNGDTTTAWFEVQNPSGGPFQSQNLGNGNVGMPMLAYTLTGLTPNTTYNFRIQAGNTNGGPITGSWVSFTTATLPVSPSISPVVVSATATNITSTSADLNGVVNPNGYNTTAWFEVENPSSGPLQSQSVGGGNVGTPMLVQNLTGLTPSTTYAFRIITGNNNSSVTGSWVSFTTNPIPASPSPTIISASATGVTTTTATLNGIVNPNGFTTTAWFEVQNPSGGPFQTQNLGNGNLNTTMLTYNLTGLTPSTTYSFRVIAGNTNGPATGSWVSFTTASSGGGCGLTPSITSLSPSSVTAGSGAALITITGTNFVNGTSSALFNAITRTTNFLSSTSLTIGLTAADVLSAGSGNITVANGACTSGSATFIVNAIGGGGGGGSNGGGGGITYPVSVVTQNATSMTTNSVALNGLINPNGFATTAWFEYGTGSTLSNFSEIPLVHASQGTSTTASALTQNITGLIPNTTYYFRAVANNSFGIVKGNILSFHTTGATNPTTPVTPTTPTTPTSPTTTGSTNPANVGITSVVTNHPTTTVTTSTSVTSNQSSGVANILAKNDTSANIAKLEITNTKEKLAVGDDVNYSVTFQNISSDNLENIKINIQLPKEIDFVGSDLGTLGNDNTIIFNAKALAPVQTITINIKGKVNSNASLQNVIVTTAVASYNIMGSSVQKNAISYITNSVTTSTGLEANSIFSIKTLPRLIGWIAFMLAILAIIIVGRRKYKESQQNQ